MKYPQNKSSIFVNLRNIFNILFGICFAILLFNIIFNNHPITDTSFEYVPRKVVKSTIAWFVLIACFYFVISAKKDWLSKNKTPIVVILFFLMIGIQTFFAFELEVESGGDLKAVYKGGVAWATTQDLGYLKDYFYVYPYNIVSAFIFKTAYTIALSLSIENHFLAGVILNLIFINTSFIFVYLIAFKFWGIRAAFMALLLCLSCLPVYFYTPIFYSDTFSLPFLVAGLYLYIIARDATKKSTQIWLFALIGLTYGIGVGIKFSIFVCIIAMLLDTIWHGRFKQLLLPFSIALFLVFFTRIAFFNFYIYQGVLDKNIAHQKSLPYIHWIAMGIKGYGNYDNKSVEFMMSIPGEERASTNIQIIKSKLQEYGVRGYTRFLAVKGVHSFGSGVYGVYQILDDDPKNQSFLHEFALLDGKHFSLFNHICQGWHILILVFIILSAFLDIKSKEIYDQKDLFLRLSVFGIYLFLLIWESNPRYLLNFIPVFILCATKGIITIGDLLSKKLEVMTPGGLKPHSAKDKQAKL